jgi:vacuolar-type H+-ATPase subunit H
MADIQDRPVFSIPSVKKPDSFTSPVRVEIPVLRESDVIIKDAKRKARHIIAEAEDIIKKEAKKKAQTHVNKILDDAREEAEDIISKATHDADRERAVATLTLKEEKERVIGEITEKYTRESRQQASQIIEDAREKSAAMMKEILASSEEIGRQINEIINRAKNTVAEFETKLQMEASELTKAISEAQSRLLELTMTPVKETPEPAEDAGLTPVRTREQGKNPSMSVHLTSDGNRDKAAGRGLFSGHLQMTSASASFDYQYLKNLKKYLVHIPNIKYVQESASEREISVQFDVKEPLPLIDILNRIPIIDEVVSETDEDICLIFKSTE